MHSFFGLADLRRPRVLSNVFGCGASKAPTGKLRRMSRYRPSSLAVRLSIQPR